jgi:hypothetical protein
MEDTVAWRICRKNKDLSTVQNSEERGWWKHKVR